MLPMKRTVAALAVALSAPASTPVLADIWVFEPSVTLDQRFDDNYFLSTPRPSSLSATRGVAEIGVSREASDYVLKGLARIDTLLTSSADLAEEGLDSNYIVGIDARRRSQRSRYGVLANFKQDTPSRDIAADLSDNEAIAEDTGLLVSQSLTSNVARDDYTIEPSFEYDVSRRLRFDIGGSFTDVSHGLPNSQDVIFERYETSYANNAGNCTNVQEVDENGDPVFTTDPDNPDPDANPIPVYVQATNALGELIFDENNEPVRFVRPQLSYSELTGEDRCVGFFSPNSELDDYSEIEIELGLRFKLTPIVTLTAGVAYSHFTADVLASDAVEFAEDGLLIVDEDIRQIGRIPRRDLVSTTTKFTLGYERFLTPTLQFVIDGGVYTNTTDDSDLFRPGDKLKQNREQPELGKKEDDGWLASTSLTYDAGATRYSARFAVDVKSSSAGAQVETNELTGDVKRTLSPRLDVSLRARAFEPDRIGTRRDDKFARRFISFEPRVQWKYSRNWTLSAAYRYRRQKAQIDPLSAESNAILLAITYTPPSELRDTARANGL